MKRIERLALACLAVAAAGIVPAAARAQLPSPSAAAVFAPGTYRQVDPPTGRVRKVGNTLTIVKTATGLHYSLAAIRASDLNNGEIAGALPMSHTATATDAAAKCRLYFTANATGLIISQDLPYGDCGFGYGVVASGIYARTSR